MVVYNYERDGVILYDYEVIGSQSRVRVEITTAFGVVVIIVIIAAWALLASHGVVIIC